MKSKTILKLFIAGCIFGGLALNANAATITVTSIADPDNTTGSCLSNGSCSIRQAINAAAGADTIDFNIPPADCPAGVCTLDLSLGGLLIDKGLTIAGPGARKLIVRRADGTNPLIYTIFSIQSAKDITVNITGLTVANGASMGATGGIYCNGPIHVNLTGVSVSGNAGFAGGIYTNGGGVLTIINSAITNNVGQVGGIANAYGTVIIANSTISTNKGGGAGLAGGISNGLGEPSAVTLDLNNVTVTGNKGTGNDLLNAGGIKNFGTAHSRNSIIDGNTSDLGSADDARGIFISQGSNLVGNSSGSFGFGFPGSGDMADRGAGLFGLGNYGGQTNTHGITTLIPFTSPAIDRGSNCVVTATCDINNPPVPLVYDQRGAPYARNSGGTVDIGAFEYQPEPVTPPGTVGGRVYASSGGGLGNAIVILTEANGQSRTALTNPNGFYRFEGVAPGQMATLSISSKKFRYAPQVIGVTGATPDTYFLPQ